MTDVFWARKASFSYFRHFYIRQISLKKRWTYSKKTLGRLETSQSGCTILFLFALLKKSAKIFQWVVFWTRKVHFFCSFVQQLELQMFKTYSKRQNLVQKTNTTSRTSKNGLHERVPLQYFDILQQTEF